MEMSSAKWLSEMEIMEDPSCSLLHQYEMNTFDYSIDDLHFQSFSPQSYSSYNPNLQPMITTPTPTPPSNIIETCSTRPLKQLKTNSSCTSQPQQINPNSKASPPSYSSHLISFGSSDSLPATYVDGQDCSNLKPPKVEDGSINGTTNFPPMMMYQASNKRSIGGSTRTPLHAQEHVIAERKRRERLSQRFIALSAVVPGLKKTDKASVLGDTIKYLKQLQERAKTLEEQTAKITVESVVFVKKSQLISSDDETSSCDESFTSQSTQPLPEIEARVSDKDVLIKIHCEKQKGCTVKILNEVEKLHLTVINSTVLPFGKSIFDITIVAKMEEGMCMPARDLARNLRAALLQFM